MSRPPRYPFAPGVIDNGRPVRREPSAVQVITAVLACTGGAVFGFYLGTLLVLWARGIAP